MNGHPETIILIRQMREAGDSIDEIASDLAISLENVGRIARKFETEEILSVRSSRFLGEIRKADDLDKKWKVSYLVQAVRPLVITQTAIIRHFEWGKATEISLRQLMDLAIPEQEHPRPGYLLTPLLRVRCVGVEGFWSLIGRLTQADLGETCNREWRKRLPRLQRSLRIAGAESHGSKPSEMPTWVQDLVVTIS
jgi:hypothetical protein